MGTPRPAVNPRTHSTGIDSRLISITDIPEGQNQVICVDRTGVEVRVPYLTHRTKGQLPRVGENWLISQDSGTWMFSQFIGQTPADFNVDGGTINEGSVPGSALVPASVTLGEIEPGSLDGSVFGPGSVSGSVLEEDSVPVSALEGGALTTVDTSLQFDNQSVTLGANPGQASLYSAEGQIAMADENGLNLNVSGSAAASAMFLSGIQTNANQNTILSLSIPGGDAEDGATYTVFAQGTFTTVSVTPDAAIFTLFWGSTSLGGLSVPTLQTNITGAGWFFRATVNFISSTECINCIEVGWHSATGVSNSITYFASGIDTSGINTTSTATLALKFQWTTSPGGTNLIPLAGNIGRTA